MSDKFQGHGAKDHDMSPHRADWIDRDTAEALLTGVPAARRGAGRVGEHLASAAAPGHPHELAGRSAALAAFRAAHLYPAPEQRRTSVMKTLVAKLLTIKAAALLSVVAGGGIALAATTGALPHSLGHLPTGAPKAAHASARPGSTPSHPSPGRPSAMPSEALVGLCHAYVAGAGADHGKALSSPAFTDLITAAGGTDKVDAFCATVLAASPSKASSRPSTHPASASAGRPTTGATHAPTATTPGAGSERPTTATASKRPSGPPSRSGH